MSLGAFGSPTAPVVVNLGGVLNSETDDTPAFTPDGDTVFFDRSIGSAKTIMISRRVNGNWTVPEIAEFSGHSFDQNPVLSPDGSFLIFDSDRPINRGGKPLVQAFFAKPGPGSNLWRVDRHGASWGQPEWLGPVINDSTFIDFPSIANDGSIYFIRVDQGAVHIFRSQYQDGKYQHPEQVKLGDQAVSTHDPTVAPPGGHLIMPHPWPGQNASPSNGGTRG